MARDGSVQRLFGGAEQVFRLRYGQLFELQDKINRPRVQVLAAAGVVNPPLLGPYSLLKLLASGDLWPHEIREVLRLGLTGGGMKPAAADLLLQHHFATLSLIEQSELAQAVVAAAVVGEDAAPVGKDAPAEATTEPSTGSTGASSTETQSSSASIREPSTIFPSPNSPP